jgi:hypothetical protein
MAISSLDPHEIVKAAGFAVLRRAPVIILGTHADRR